MPSAIPPQDETQDYDQSMMDAAPQDPEQQYRQEEDDLLEMEEKRIVIVVPLFTFSNWI